MSKIAEIRSLKETPNELYVKTGMHGYADDYEAHQEYQKAAGIRENLVEGLDLAVVPNWRVAKSLAKLKSQINESYPERNTAKDGTIGDARHCPNLGHTGSSDHCLNIEDSGVRIVTALDVTHDLEKCDVNKIVESIRSARDQRIKYMIWNRRICNSKPINEEAAWAWRDYGGSNPHTGHAHFSVESTKSKYDDESIWEIES